MEKGKNEKKDIGDIITMGKDFNIQIPKHLREKLNLEPGDNIVWGFDEQGNPTLTKSETTYVTVEIPTKLYDKTHHEMKKHGYDTTVDQYINNAVTSFLEDFHKK